MTYPSLYYKRNALKILHTQSGRIKASEWFKYAVPWSNLEAEYLFYMFEYIKFDLTNKQAVDGP